MVIGRFDAKISKKQQIVFPKQLRQILGNRLIITKGLDKNLLLVSLDKWEVLLEGTRETPFLNKRVRQIQRFLLGNAQEARLDSYGRFVLPEHLKSYAGIGEDVVFAGIREFVEVWDKKIWEGQQEFLDITAEQIAEELSRKDVGGK